MLLYLNLICWSLVFVRRWCGQTSNRASACLCSPQVQHSFWVCEEQVFCNGDTCTCASWISWAGLFLIPSMWGDYSLQWGCSPCLGGLGVFLLHLSPVHSSSPSWHPCWPCLWLALPQFVSRAVPAALQTKLLVTHLCLQLLMSPV
jgi:hypothetical protein